MDADELKMHSRRLQHFYPYLELSAEQVGQIVAFEERPSFLGEVNEFFSYWEEWEYQLDEFRKILTDEQFRLHEEEQKKVMLRHEERLSNEDADLANELAYEEEYTGWMRDVFIPGLREEAMYEGILLVLQRDKIAYLHKEYARFLVREQYNLLVRHYRYSRRLQPNALRMAQLRHERSSLFPDYEAFRREADPAVCAVGAFLLDQYRIFARQKIEFFQNKSAGLKKQREELRMNHTGERLIRGWHTTIFRPDELPIEEEWIMSLLLMER